MFILHIFKLDNVYITLFIWIRFTLPKEYVHYPFFGPYTSNIIYNTTHIDILFYPYNAINTGNIIIFNDNTKNVIVHVYFRYIRVYFQSTFEYNYKYI